MNPADGSQGGAVQGGRGALFPVRADWLNHSLMLTVSTLLVVVITNWLELPTDKAVISVFFLAMTADVQSALRKGKLRLLGAFSAPECRSADPVRKDVDGHHRFGVGVL